MCLLEVDITECPIGFHSKQDLRDSVSCEQFLDNRNVQMQCVLTTSYQVSKIGQRLVCIQQPQSVHNRYY